MIFTAALVLTGCNKNLEQFTVTPTSLEFSGEAGSQTVTVTAGETWALKVTEGSSWITTSKTYGKSSTTVEIFSRTRSTFLELDENAFVDIISETFCS